MTCPSLLSIALDPVVVVVFGRSAGWSVTWWPGPKTTDVHRATRKNFISESSFARTCPEKQQQSRRSLLPVYQSRMLIYFLKQTSSMSYAKKRPSIAIVQKYRADGYALTDACQILLALLTNLNVGCQKGDRRRRWQYQLRNRLCTSFLYRERERYHTRPL